MKTNKENGHPTLTPRDSVLDRHSDDSTKTRGSWLDQIYQETPRAQKSALFAELFLHTRLFPRIEAGEPLDEQILIELLVEFLQFGNGEQISFEMAQVAARLLSRFQCHLLDEEHSSVSTRSGALERELVLFNVLAELDFQRIDQAVRKRLHSD